MYLRDNNTTFHRTLIVSIEDFVYKGYDDGYHPVCRYVMVIERDIRYSDDLLTL